MAPRKIRTRNGNSKTGRGRRGRGGNRPRGKSQDTEDTSQGNGGMTT